MSDRQLLQKKDDADFASCKKNTYSITDFLSPASTTLNHQPQLLLPLSSLACGLNKGMDKFFFFFLDILWAGGREVEKRESFLLLSFHVCGLFELSPREREREREREKERERSAE